MPLTDLALHLCVPVWAIGHLAQIVFLIRVGVKAGPPLAEREETLLGVTLFASLPSMLGLPLALAAGPAAAFLAMPLLAIGGLVTLACALVPPPRGQSRGAWASRLCAAAPPWAALYVLFRILMSI
jgi:hypothetical protein